MGSVVPWSATASFLSSEGGYLRGDVVYGSRYLPDPSRGVPYNLVMGKHARQTWSAHLGGRSLSLVALLGTGCYLTDTVTASKLFHRDRFVGTRTFLRFRRG